MSDWDKELQDTVKQLRQAIHDQPEIDEFYKKSLLTLQRMPDEAKQVRYASLDNLYTFANLVNPGYMYGDIHKEAFDWIQDYQLYGEESGLNKLLMFPRAHLKSHIVATATAWLIARHPEVTVLYLSATAELSETQLYAIKSILSGDKFTRYFPEYIHPMEGKREKWTERKIVIDHIRRRNEATRDPTIATAGLTTNTTGWHADIIVPDDLVVPENAYTEEGRRGVAKKASQFTSIRNPGGFTLACGTRYHPSDIYSSWKEQKVEVYDSDGEMIDRVPIWDVMERVVEVNGMFLWPRVVRGDGKVFGFDKNVLARIRGEYEDITQFFAQYYNNPNETGTDRISRECFQYFEPRHLRRSGNGWCIKDKKLNLYASVDFAFSLSKRADYTSVVVIGICPEGDIYVLDIDRFKTDRTIEYFKHIAQLHSKWEFKKLRAEVTVAQQIIVNDIKEYIKKEGLYLKVEEYRPTRSEGSKEERIAAALEHRYENRSIWHYKGGFTPVLEEELVLAKPPHDDVKDALASAVMIAIKPKGRTRPAGLLTSGLITTKRSRFGGVPYR
ncbi:MAG: putative terminase large subunit [Prokaryotic dsDNA virus sp.]|nr:MAG: putative terminase large subunit [Prokaryotic dsDNA virus sp.]|tara:strand:+ start:37702 stop:39372 length:1671 start_codon:yes stop_codon:yes gene_type:complete